MMVKTYSLSTIDMMVKNMRSDLLQILIIPGFTLLGSRATDFSLAAIEIITLPTKKKYKLISR